MVEGMTKWWSWTHSEPGVCNFQTTDVLCCKPDNHRAGGQKFQGQVQSCIRNESLS